MHGLCGLRAPGSSRRPYNLNLILRACYSRHSLDMSIAGLICQCLCLCVWPYGMLLKHRPGLHGNGRFGRRDGCNGGRNSDCGGISRAHMIMEDVDCVRSALFDASIKPGDQVGLRALAALPEAPELPAHHRRPHLRKEP